MDARAEKSSIKAGRLRRSIGDEKQAINRSNVLSVKTELDDLRD